MSRTTHRRRVARWAALVCAGALALTGCDFSVYSLPLPGGADLGEHPYSVRVKFRDVLDLVPESAVKVNDVTVGKVDTIELDHYTADVTLLLRDDVELPDNAEAQIRQTSLLGEKFVSLEAPEQGASSNLLADGDVIPLARSGRNPEVEEVLGALSLLLNGGGVAQLKTISTELNKALAGREGDVKGVLHQLDTFMGQLDENKADIVRAIESLNKLAISVNKQRGSIELALDEMPQALASIDRQRDDLVTMLDALTELSSVGTRVIRASKAATIDSLQQLDPILTKLAEAGDALPKAFQVFLTYPFVDEVVGRNPAQARNLHMGDYTNLSIQLDLDLRNGLPTLPGLPSLPGIPDLPVDPDEVLSDVQKCLRTQDPNSNACQSLTKKQLRRLKRQLDEQCAKTPGKPLCDALLGGDGDDGGGLLGGLLGGGTGTTPGSGDDGDGGGGGDCGIPLLCRAAPALGARHRSGDDVSLSGIGDASGFDPELAALLTWGMVQR
ncbi:MAG TPA: MCE family protein [Nocardioidaceae bacterium]|nr:MCE family protein [Nocardioidaceae bacterium]